MIRQYHTTDYTAVIDIFRKLVPAYFAKSEEKDFEMYLQNDAGHYYLVVKNDMIIASGGVNYGFESGKTARLSWDLVHPAYFRKGIGSRLTQYRIKEIRKNPAIRKIVVRTSQRVYPFYLKHGFQLEQIESDYWAKGFDLYQLALILH